MVGIKDAVQSAIRFATDSVGDDRVIEPRLEEVDSGTINGRECWILTLSVGEARGCTDLIPIPRKREYKTFTVDKITGDTFKRTQNFTVQDFMSSVRSAI